MRRTVILRADSVALDGGGGAIVPGTSPYPWQSSPGMTVYDIWNAGPVNNQYAFFWTGLIPTWAVGFEPGPTLSRFTKVTIQAGFDYAQGGPNSWWFPPDNAHGPIATLILRNRAGSGYHFGTGSATYTVLGPPTDDHNVNMNTSPVFYKLRTLSWELAAHPEGGPWTLEDINDLAAGVAIAMASGPNGLPWDPDGTAFHRMRVPYLTVTLEVEDLGGDVRGPRVMASTALRLKRRARDVVRPKQLIHHVPTGIMGVAYLEHPRGPAVGGRGWGPRRLELRAAQVVHRTYHPESLQVEDELFDLRKYACLGWATYRIDGPWSPELQGVALVEKGKGFIHDRGQDAWSPRPGDGVLMRVLEGYPNVSYHGLAIQGGGDVAICLRNYDLMQAGWSTVGSSGFFSVVADDDVTMVQEAGFLSTARLVYGVGGGTGGRQRSLGTLPHDAGDRIHVRAVVLNTSVNDPETEFAEVMLQRSGGSLPATEYWDEAARAWTTTPAHNPIPSDGPVGELVMDAIPCDAPLAASAPTYAIAVGRFSSNISSVTFHGALVDVFHSDGTVAGCRTSQVTLDVEITREPDTHLMQHAWGRELWAHERGTHVVELRPFFRSELLPDDTVVPLLHAKHAANTWQALQFIARGGGSEDDVVRFESAIEYEDTFQLDCPITGVDINRTHVLRAWVRYLGADGWKDYGPYSVEVGYMVTLAATGAVVSQGSVLGRLATETAVPYEREHLAVGCDDTRFAEGWVRMWETRRNPLHRLEALWKV